jgi:hypothetical protein
MGTKIVVHRMGLVLSRKMGHKIDGMDRKIGGHIHKMGHETGVRRMSHKNDVHKMDHKTDVHKMDHKTDVHKQDFAHEIAVRGKTSQRTVVRMIHYNVAQNIDSVASEDLEAGNEEPSSVAAFGQVKVQAETEGAWEIGETWET